MVKLNACKAFLGWQPFHGTANYGSTSLECNAMGDSDCCRYAKGAPHRSNLLCVRSLHVWVYCNSSPCSCQRSDDVNCSWQNHNFSLTAYMIPTFRLSAGAQLARLLANYQHSVCDVPFVKHSGSCLPSAECPQFFPHYAPTPSEMQVQKVRSHKFQSMRSLAREYTVIKL